MLLVSVSLLILFTVQGRRYKKIRTGAKLIFSIEASHSVLKESFIAETFKYNT